MSLWKMKYGVLFYDKICIEHYNLSIKDDTTDDMYLKFMNYKLEISPCFKYCIVYSDNNFYCDIYDNKPSLIFYKRKHTYKREFSRYIVKFLIHPETHETLFLINEYPGTLSIYRMNSEIYLEYELDFELIEILNKDYFIAHTSKNKLLFNVKQFLENKYYKPDIIISYEKRQIANELLNIYNSTNNIIKKLIDKEFEKLINVEITYQNEYIDESDFDFVGNMNYAMSLLKIDVSVPIDITNEVRKCFFGKIKVNHHPTIHLNFTIKNLNIVFKLVYGCRLSIIIKHNLQ